MGRLRVGNGSAERPADALSPAGAEMILHFRHSKRVDDELVFSLAYLDIRGA